MTGDLPAAALRLMSQCPVRTHEAKLPTRSEANHTRPVKIGGVTYESLTEAARQLRCNRETLRKRLKAGKTDAPSKQRGGSNRRAIYIQGVRYDSLRAAISALRVGNTRIYQWLDSGRARYAEKHE